MAYATGLTCLLASIIECGHHAKMPGFRRVSIRLKVVVPLFFNSLTIGNGR